MADQQPGRFTVDRCVGLGKDAMVVLRDGALLLLAGLLLLFPAKFNDVLVGAGFEEGSIVGFKWKSKLVQSDDALKAAQATIADLKVQLEKTSNALVAAQGRTGDEVAKGATRKLDAENRQLTASSAQVEATVRSTIASNAAFVEKAQSAVSTTGGWGVVFGSDVSLAAAKDEISRAAKRGVLAPSVYFRNGYYASISVVESRTTAQQYLGIAKGFRPDAYITTMSTWCRNPMQREGYVECQNNP